MFVTSPKFHKYSMHNLNVLINVHIPVMCNSCGSLNSECVYTYIIYLSSTQDGGVHNIPLLKLCYSFSVVHCAS